MTWATGIWACMAARKSLPIAAMRTASVVTDDGQKKISPLSDASGRVRMPAPLTAPTVHRSWHSPVPRSRHHRRYVSLLSACTIAPLIWTGPPRPISSDEPVPDHHAVPVCHCVTAGRKTPSVSVETDAPSVLPGTTLTPRPNATFVQPRRGRARRGRSWGDLAGAAGREDGRRRHADLPAARTGLLSRTRGACRVSGGFRESMARLEVEAGPFVGWPALNRPRQDRATTRRRFHPLPPGDRGHFAHEPSAQCPNTKSAAAAPEWQSMHEAIRPHSTEAASSK